MTRSSTSLARGVGVALVGSIACWVSAAVLWLNPGTTVTNGPPFASAVCVLILTAAFLVILRIDRTRRVSVVAGRVLLALEIVVLGAGTLVWRLEENYFTGWLVTFAAVVVGVSGTWRLLAVLVMTHETPTNTRAGQTQKRVWLSRSVTTALTALTGVAGLVATSTVHEWQLAIVSPLVVLVSASLLIAVYLSRVVSTHPAHPTPVPSP